MCRRGALLDDWIDRDPISERAPMRWEILSGFGGDDHADHKCAEPRSRSGCTIRSAATAKQFQKEAGSAEFGCSAPGWPLFVGALASTSDGGLSWAPDLIPSDVPQPLFEDLSCPTVSQCWVTGSDAVPRQVGITHDGGQPILLGTTDGGATWSGVTFSVPEGAPDAYSQSYLSLGGISCPSAGSCVALGDAAQSAPSSPVYSLSAQDRANPH